MIPILAKIFIKDKNNTASSEVREKYGVLCGGVGIFLNICLFLGKFFAGIISNSIAITADAFNNLSDAGSSVITLIGFKLAGRKPDPDHPFGHGRMEYVSGLLVSVVILMMAFELIKSSIGKIIHPEAVDSSPVVIIILVASIVVKVYMCLYNRKYGKMINSAAMRATSTDSLGDSLATTVVLIATLIAKFTSINIDGYCGVLVGLFILYAGYTAMMETVALLMGKAPDSGFVDSINGIVLSHEKVIGIHDLIVHDYGPGRVMISLHAEVPASEDILEMHDLIDNIEMDLRRELNCEATIHMDPVVQNDEYTDSLKTNVLAILHDIDEHITMHDFRAVKGPTHTNMIFDVVVPYRFKMSDNDVRKAICDRVGTEMDNCFAVIQVDKYYSGKQ
ncbi:MAG: cation transporter [Clostridia bacterium]|nr:cation transporter [Clostridia bacterium]